MKKILMLVLLMFAAMSVSAQVYTDVPDTIVIIEEIDSTLHIVQPDSIIDGNVVVDSINQGETVNPDTIYTVHSITQDQFREIVAEYDSVDWVMKSPRPVIVDFYADWCEPCKRLEPVLREVAQHYDGQVDFYRIDVDANPEIADVFLIRSIPYLLICPLEGEPLDVIGLYSKQEYIRVIDRALEYDSAHRSATPVAPAD